MSAEAKFQAHLQTVPAEHRLLVIDAYAKPVENQLDLQQPPIVDSLINEDATVC
jgi:hypothetical protein